MMNAVTTRKTVNPHDFLDGQSPQQRAKEKLKKTLDWIYRWGFTTEKVIHLLSGQQAHTYAKSLVKRGYLVETKTLTGSPKFFYTLSEIGLQAAEREALQVYEYKESNAYKVNQALIRHHVLAQISTFKSLDSGKIVDFLTERQVSTSVYNKFKIPDVIWQLKDKRTIGVEVELSAKWSRKLDDFVLRIHQALDSKLYHFFVIATDSPAIQSRYEAAFKQPVVNRWQENNRGHYHIVEQIDLPPTLSKQLIFRLMQDE